MLYIKVVLEHNVYLYYLTTNTFQQYIVSMSEMSTNIVSVDSSL